MKIIIFCCFSFIVLKQLIIIVNACTCLPATTEENYCGSDWAAHILSLKKEKINETEGFSKYVRYTVEILDIYKGKINMSSKKKERFCLYGFTKRCLWR
uniref:Uncharacterized protein n=1 Tax=Meloidogyne enterolobii TaxID=390850 RepID=A0A6V7WHM7_MELEN|nr:unnamed protein product [Meloidogyne enterolobii]